MSQKSLLCNPTHLLDANSDANLTRSKHDQKVARLHMLHARCSDGGGLIATLLAAAA